MLSHMYVFLFLFWSVLLGLMLYRVVITLICEYSSIMTQGPTLLPSLLPESFALLFTY